jgi:hypothetical protein
VATGAVLATLSTPGIVEAVYGGFRAAQDRTPPTVAITTPAEGANYLLDQQVLADYACADLGGSGLATCVGSVADGAPIDTGAVGPKTFVATASDGPGTA